MFGRYAACSRNTEDHIHCLSCSFAQPTGLSTPLCFLLILSLTLSVSYISLLFSLFQFSGSIDPQKKTNNDFERFFLVKTITAAMDILAAVALLASDGHR
jgi:hypothetical protein